MPDPRYDPARLTEHARQLRTLADQGRAALNQDTVQRNTRLGQQRDDAARRAQGTEQQWKAAEAQAKKELTAAEASDKAAAALEQRAAKEFDAELREAAADQRALAESHRQRAHAAETEAETTSTRWMEERVMVEDLDKQLSAETARRTTLDREVDKLEEHADTARWIADIGDEVTRLETRLEAAETQGDDVVAGRLRNQITEARKAMDTFHDARAKLTPPDAQVMTDLGVTVPPGVFDLPSAPIAPTPPGAPLPEDLAATDGPAATDGRPSPPTGRPSPPPVRRPTGRRTTGPGAGGAPPSDESLVAVASTADRGAGDDGGLEELVMPTAGDERAASARTIDPLVAATAATATAAATLADPFVVGDLGDPGFTPPGGGGDLGDPGFTPPGGDGGGELGDPGFTPRDDGLDPGVDRPGLDDPGFTPPGGDDGGGFGDPGFTPPGGDDGGGFGDPGFTPPGGEGGGGFAMRS